VGTLPSFVNSGHKNKWVEIIIHGEDGPTYINCARAGRGKSFIDLKHEELIGWIKQQNVIFSREKLLESYEAFQAEVLKRETLAMGTVDFLPAHTKQVCEEINSSVKGWTKSTRLSLDVSK